MKNKKKVNNDIINLEDDIKDQEINKDIKENDPSKKSQIEAEIKLAKEKKQAENKKSKEGKLENTEKIEIKEEKKEKIEKSKLNIVFLLLALIITILYGISIFINLDFQSLNIKELIKPIAFLLISFLIIIILFKVNTKKTTPYVILLTLVLIAYSAFSISTSYAKEDQDIYVQDFINKSIVEVIDWAEKYDIELIELHEFSDTIPKNYVILQEYGITTLINDIDSFTVTISDGPNYDKEITVPNLTGFTYDEVMTYIKENFLSNVEIEFIKSEQERDKVIEQIGSGTMKRSDKITFIFSRGLEDEQVPVEDLTGLSLFEATSYLKRYNIPYEIEYKSDDKVLKDYVISQDIIEKIVTDKVTLTVSLGKEIIVPDLSKMTTTEIAKWAVTNNIKINYVEEYNKEYALGEIIKISKNEGDIIQEEATITITLSKGSMTMPKVTSLAEFKLWANSNNISYEEVYEYSNTYKSGEIIKTSPSENEKITENDTIIITISKGKSVKVPSFIGLSKTNIQSKCNDLNLSCTFTYGGYTESTKKDIALKQSKSQGTVVSEGTNVLITLSSGIYEKVTVPSFKGKSKSQITSTCNSLGINCIFKYNSTYSSETKDTAISQDKTGSVIKGSNVTITLSLGPAKTYTVVIDGTLLSQGNPEQTKKTLKSKLESACPGVTFNFTFKSVNSGIGYLNADSEVHVGSNTFVQGQTYNVIINSN